MVKIEKTETEIKVKAPFNPTFIKKAKGLKGKWDGEYWVLPIKTEELVRNLLNEIYGTDGENHCKFVTVDLDLDTYEGNDDHTVKVGELVLVERLRRDSDVVLSKETMIIKGGFPSRGGSTKTPRLEAFKETILRVEIPETIFEKIKEMEGVKLVVAEKTKKEIKNEIEKIEVEIKKLEQLKEELLKKLKK